MILGSVVLGKRAGHRGFPLVRDSSLVKKGDVVGYVGDRYENGDGLEHLHLGLRKGLYDGYFRGYARLPYCTPKHYHAPAQYIRARSGAMRLASKIESFPTVPGNRGVIIELRAPGTETWRPVAIE